MKNFFCLLILKSQTDYNQNLTTHNVTNSNSHKKTKPMKLIRVLIKWLAQRKKNRHTPQLIGSGLEIYSKYLWTLCRVCVFFLFLFMLSIVNNSSKPQTDTSYNNIIFIISFCFVLMN